MKRRSFLKGVAGLGALIASGPSLLFSKSKIPELVEGRWYHVAFTRNQNLYSMYVDGKLVNPNQLVFDFFDTKLSQKTPKIAGITFDNITTSGDVTIESWYKKGNSVCMQDYRVTNALRYQEDFFLPIKETING